MISKKRVSISIQQGVVKIVYATIKGKVIWIDDFITISQKEFENFLKQEKEKRFYLNIYFDEMIQEIFSFPPAKKSDLNKMIQIELSNLYPQIELTDWLYCYFLLNERVDKGKRKKDISVFAIPKSSVDKIIKLFLTHKKEIIALCPNYLPLLNLIPKMDFPAIYFYKSNSINSTILLIKEKRIYLVRNVIGNTDEVGNLDIQNINMTINYSIQKLKIDPRYVFIIGSQKISKKLNILPNRPFVTLLNSTINILNNVADKEKMDEYILPISMLSPENIKNSLFSNIQRTPHWVCGYLPLDYKFLKKLMIYIRTSIYIMIIMFPFLLSILIFQITKLKDKDFYIESLRKNIGEINNIWIKYQSVINNWNKYAMAINMINNSTASFSPNEFLFKLSKTVLEGINIKSIKIEKKEYMFIFSIKGIVKGENFTEKQRKFRMFLELLKTIQNINILQKKFSFEKGNFNIIGEIKIKSFSSKENEIEKRYIY